jgi:hypothetical protein
MLANIPKVTLPLHANELVLTLWQSQTGQVIIAVRFVPKAIASVIELLFHFSFLPFIFIFPFHV